MRARAGVVPFLAIAIVAAMSLGGSALRSRGAGERITGGDEPLWTPLSAYRVVGTVSGPDVHDVPVNDPARAGDLANCAIQSESSIAAYGAHVYVGYNDGEGCVSNLDLDVTGFASSDDGGATFHDLGPVPEPAVATAMLGDPSLAVDTTGADAGTLYYASLAFDQKVADAIVLGRSTDGGATFDWTLVPGVASGRDKEWIAVDNSGGPFDGTIYLAWTQFTSGNNGQIELVRSADGGHTWSTPQILGAGIVQGARIAVASDGTALVTWESDVTSTNPSISWTRSTNGGASFAPAAVAVAGLPVMGHLTYCAGDVGLRRVVNGDIRVIDWPSLAIDTFGSSDPSSPDYNPGLGDAYVVYPARASDGLTFGATSDGGDESDVFLARLPAGSSTWTRPVRVNDDHTATDQLFPEVAVAGPGEVAVSWTDRREDAAVPAPAGDRLMRQWIAVSTDSGATFSTNRPFSDVQYPPPVSNPNMNPNLAGCYAGDYNQLISDAPGHVLATWSDTRDSIKVTDGQQNPPVQTIPDPNVYFRSSGV